MKTKYDTCLLGNEDVLDVYNRLLSGICNYLLNILSFLSSGGVDNLLFSVSGELSTNINHKGLQRTANEYAGKLLCFSAS